MRDEIDYKLAVGDNVLPTDWMNDVGDQYLKIESGLWTEAVVLPEPELKDNPFKKGGTRWEFTLLVGDGEVKYTPGRGWLKGLKSLLCAKKVALPQRIRFKREGEGLQSRWIFELMT